MRLSFHTDRSVVVAAVYGPRTIPARKESTEQLHIEVVYRPASGLQSECRAEERMTHLHF